MIMANKRNTYHNELLFSNNANFLNLNLSNLFKLIKDFLSADVISSNWIHQFTIYITTDEIVGNLGKH
jgi:hypothetical protein